MQGHMIIETNKEVQLRKKAPSIKDNDFLKNIVSKLNHIDVLIGGPPCQGFSMIGRSKKATLEERTKGFIDDPRNQLFKYYLKFAEKLSPKLVLIENVKGLASASGYRDLIENSLKDTGKFGYDTSSHILNAKDFGLAQSRERIFFIGVRKDLTKKHNINASHIFDEIIKSKKEPLKLKDIIFDLPQIKANPKPNNYEEESEIPFNKMKLCFGQNISDKSYTDLLNKKVNINYLSSINTYNGKLITPKHLFNHKSRYHNARDLFIYRNLVAGKYLNDPVNKKALSKVTYGVVVDENGVKKVKGFGDKYFKLNPESVSKTIIAHLETDGNSYVHPGEQPRSITPREAARIQSFPDWYFFTGSTRNQFKQIGNAVPPILGSVFAEHFKNVLDLIGKDAR
jgi:DNA (cytosine-5)-methyltransferase 1